MRALVHPAGLSVVSPPLWYSAMFPARLCVNTASAAVKVVPSWNGAGVMVETSVTPSTHSGAIRWLRTSFVSGPSLMPQSYTHWCEM